VGIGGRLLAAALSLSLGGCAAGGTPPLAPTRPLAGIRSWAVYYGAEPAAAGDLARFDLVVLDPARHPPLEVVARHGTLVLMYVSLGEVNVHHPAYPPIAGEAWVLSPNPNWPGARRLDVRAAGYERWLLDRVVPAALLPRTHGLFLDTADTAVELERADPGRFAGSAAALERVLARLRERHPRALLVLNGGLGVAERLHADLDAVAVESVWSDYDFAARAYRARMERDGEARAAALDRLRALGLPVLVLEYAPPGDGAWVQSLIGRARARGFVPYVSTIGLDRVYTHTLDRP
jgi:hypothetical protein